MFFVLLLVGYILRKLNIISTQGRKCLTDLVIDVILPANIICSFMIELNDEIVRSCVTIFVASVIIQIFCYFFGSFAFKWVGKERLAVYKYGTICSNAGFLGNPLVEGIYGSLGLMYASIYLIPQRVCMWSAGVSCFTQAKGKDIVKKVLTHPCIIAVFIGIFLMATQIKLPDVVTGTLKSLSGCTTSMSMIVIGGILAEIDIKTVVNLRVSIYTFIRLVVIPAIVLAGCMAVRLSPLVVKVATVLAGMPAGSTTAILASKYNGDEKEAVKMVFFSTLLSMITIPVWCMFMENIL
ncbi:MAG: AEC family transporter [Lachnospiraceae bacterium]